MILLLLLLPQFLGADITVSSYSIQVGQPIEVTFQENHLVEADKLLSQIADPFLVEETKVEKDKIVLTLTSWEPGHHPLSLVVSKEGKTLYSDVYGIEVLAPNESVEVAVEEYLQGLLPFEGEKPSLLSAENRALVRENDLLRLEERERNQESSAGQRFPWLLLGSLIALAAIGYQLFKRLYNRDKEMEERVDPREEAAKALAQLAAKTLPELGKFDRFYVELTTVVRRYIERQYGLRAPEQTTEEFLANLQNHPSFGETVQQQLSRFLSSADMVKFACHSPEVPDCHRALAAATNFVDSDGRYGKEL